MLINLVGVQGSGKTAFAQWFVARNPEYLHCQIDNYRRYTFEDGWRNYRYAEDMAWDWMLADVSNWYNHGFSGVIIESTGTVSGIETILQYPQVINQGIYTIKMICDSKIFNIRDRNKEVIDDLFLDDFEYLQIEEQLQQDVPANLIVDTSGLTTEERMNTYLQAERAIFQAAEAFLLI